MLRFFRKIRQRLFQQNQIKKYLLYAGGEILLVMIGILLALQVNIQNQKRLNRIEEKRILASISSEVELSRFLFKNGREVQENKMQAAKDLLLTMKASPDSPDTRQIDRQIFQLNGRWLSSTPTTLYDALIGSGELKLVSSEALRNQLAQFKSDQEFLQLFEAILVNFTDQRLSPALNQYINRGKILTQETNYFGFADIPIFPAETRYDRLLADHQIANLLVECIEHTNRVIRNYERLEKSVNRIDSLAQAKYPK